MALSIRFAVIDGKGSPALQGCGNLPAIAVAFGQDAATADFEGASSAAYRVRIGLVCSPFLHSGLVGTSVPARQELAAAAVAPAPAADAVVAPAPAPVAASAGKHSHKLRGSAASILEFHDRRTDIPRRETAKKSQHWTKNS